MKISDLFSVEVDPVLIEWMRKFTSLDDLFLGMPELYAKLESQTIEGIIEDGAVLSGPVHIGRGAVVHPQAIVHGPSIVGPDTVVNSHAEIQSGSFIGSKCVIGHSCSIIHSMVMNNANICAGAFIRNCVIGTGSIVGPGAALGAVDVERAPRANSQTSSKLGAVLGDYAVVGANSTLKPGTVIGSRTLIGEGVLAKGNYESNQTVTLTQTLNVNPRNDEA
jgi:UDP-N-acetylglucosamine diphosphorylase / glucose-1-phosphate thymidylyltransferase / UDP-N-acetylgalactosamine diphosphorylase / glucosamine-1-phosphate N-acetyltransferase / galactosamine-1-phosphate N-acetyltransferase